MDEIKLPKGKIIALKVSQKTKTKHQSKALNLVVASDAENNDDELSKEDEELAFLTQREQRLLRRRKRPRRNFSKRDFQQGQSSR